MCGIVGALAHGAFGTRKEEKLRQEAMIYLTTELLQLTQSRGKDATGIATVFADGDYMGLKMGISAQEFVTRFGDKETDYEGFLNIWRKKKTEARMFIGHCRKPSTTVGAGADDNQNNHPIKVGDIVGIHNGTLTNHEKIFDNLKCGRDSKVDSEAIFRLLDHYTKGGTEPFSINMIQEVCQRLNGTYSVLAFNGNNPYQLAGFRDGRPMEFALIKPLKLFLIASEKDMLKIAINRYNKMSYLFMTGANKFPGLKKNDVEFDNTMDDSIYLFDTSQEITDDTKLSELYKTEKIPRNKKLWAKSTTTVTAAGWQNSHVGGTANQTGAASAGATNPKKTEVVINTPSSKDSEIKNTDNRVGMAWNRNIHTYDSVSGEKNACSIGCVVIDIETGQVKDVNARKIIQAGEKKEEPSTSAGESQHLAAKADSQQEFELVEIDRDVDDLVGDPAKITAAVIAKNTEPTDDNSDGNNIIAIHKAGKTLTPSTTVNVGQDVEVLEKAIEASRKQVSFSTNSELAGALEIISPRAMENMALYSLANRIKSYFFKAGWYGGFIAGKASVLVKTPENSIDIYARTMLKKAKIKTRSSASTIRNIKTMTRILSRVIGNIIDFPYEHLTDCVHKAVATTRLEGEEMEIKYLNKAFKPGDLRDQPALKEVLADIQDTTD